MHGDTKVFINIQYKLDVQEVWRDFNIQPEDYFDLDGEEQIGFDSVPVYNHAIEYIKESVDKVTATRIIISDEGKKSKRVITTTYWNEQKNSITERIDSFEGVSESELIIESRIQDIPSVYEIMRVIRNDGTLIPIYHGFITDNDDGSQKEVRFI